MNRCLMLLQYIEDSPGAMAQSRVTTVKTISTVVLCWRQQKCAHLALITMVMVVQRVTGQAERWRQTLRGIIILFSKPNERKGVAPQLTAVLF